MFKFLQNVGLTALCEHIKSIRNTADSAGAAVTSLAEAVSGLAEEMENALDSPAYIEVSDGRKAYFYYDTADEIVYIKEA